MSKKKDKNRARLGRTRSFRFDLEEDLKLRLLAARFDTNINTVLRFALNNLWEKHKNDLASIDENTLSSEFRKIARNSLL